MAYIKIALSTTLASLLFVFLSSTAISIGPVPVELVVPDTTVTVSGTASPNSLVTITRNDVVIGTTTSDSSGNYSRIFGAQIPGIQNYKSYYKDSENKRSRINSQNISVQSQQDTGVIANLSPTITRRTPSSVIKGSIIQINGYTVPNSEVTLRFSVSNITYEETSNTNGFYEFLIDSNGLSEGNYMATVSSVVNGIDLSDTSSSVIFDVVSEFEPVAPDIVVRPDQLPPPVPLSPETGTVISGDTTVISGQSIPNAQINIYENGILYSSIFSDNNGNWSFKYTARTTPVTFSFEACIDGECSVLSKAVTLEFSNIRNLTCSINFELETYRFWNTQKGNEIELLAQNVSSNGIFEVVWGDGVVEYFDYDIDSSNNTIVYEYKNSGNYNGKITLKENRNDECSKVRYFSALVDDKSTSGISSEVMWLLILIAGLLSLNYVVRKDKQKTVNNSHNKL